MPRLQNGSKGDSNPGSLDCESGILQQSHKRGSFGFLTVLISSVTEFLYLFSPYLVLRHDLDTRSLTGSNRDSFVHSMMSRITALLIPEASRDALLVKP